jgi:DNA primase
VVDQDKQLHSFGLCYSGLETAGEEPEYNINGFKAVVEVAYYLKDLFKELNISSYVKTS